MEYEACDMQKWKIPQNSIALAYAECKGLVIPCII